MFFRLISFLCFPMIVFAHSSQEKPMPACRCLLGHARMSRVDNIDDSLSDRSLRVNALEHVRQARCPIRTHARKSSRRHQTRELPSLGRPSRSLAKRAMWETQQWAGDPAHLGSLISAPRISREAPRGNAHGAPPKSKRPRAQGTGLRYFRGPFRLRPKFIPGHRNARASEPVARRARGGHERPRQEHVFGAGIFKSRRHDASFE